MSRKKDPADYKSLTTSQRRTARGRLKLHGEAAHRDYVDRTVKQNETTLSTKKKLPIELTPGQARLIKAVKKTFSCKPRNWGPMVSTEKKHDSTIHNLWKAIAKAPAGLTDTYITPEEKAWLHKLQSRQFGDSLTISVGFSGKEILTGTESNRWAHEQLSSRRSGEEMDKLSTMREPQASLALADLLDKEQQEKVAKLNSMGIDYEKEQQMLLKEKAAELRAKDDIRRELEDLAGFQKRRYKAWVDQHKNEAERAAAKPPLGVAPRNIREWQRKLELIEAMYRYADKDKHIPMEWLEELAELNKKVKDDRPRKEGDVCPSCGGRIVLISEVEPWHPEQLQCEKCDGTWCITKEDKDV